MTKKSSFIGEVFISVCQVLSFIYAFPTLFYASLTVTGIGPMGKNPVKIRVETIVLVLLGLSLLLFPIWLLVRRVKKNVPRWAEYLIFASALVPIFFYFLLIFLP